MEMLIKENAQRIYTERTAAKDTKKFLYITDFKKQKAEVVDATPALTNEDETITNNNISSNDSYSVYDNAIDYDNDPIGSFFMNATRRR